MWVRWFSSKKKRSKSISLSDFSSGKENNALESSTSLSHKERLTNAMEVDTSQYLAECSGYNKCDANCIASDDLPFLQTRSSVLSVTSIDGMDRVFPTPLLPKIRRAIELNNSLRQDTSSPFDMLKVTCTASSHYGRSNPIRPIGRGRFSLALPNRRHSCRASCGSQVYYSPSTVKVAPPDNPPIWTMSSLSRSIDSHVSTTTATTVINCNAIVTALKEKRGGKRSTLAGDGVVGGCFASGGNGFVTGISQAPGEEFVHLAKKRRTDDSRLSTTVDVCRSPPCVQPNLHPACGGYFSHGQLGHTSQRRFHSLDQRLHTPIVSSGHVRSASIVLSNVWRDGCVPSSLGGRQHYNRRILSSLSSCKRYTERRCTVQHLCNQLRSEGQCGKNTPVVVGGTSQHLTAMASESASVSVTTTADQNSDEDRSGKEFGVTPPDTPSSSQLAAGSDTVVNSKKLMTSYAGMLLYVVSQIRPLKRKIFLSPTECNSPQYHRHRRRDTFSALSRQVGTSMLKTTTLMDQCCWVDGVVGGRRHTPDGGNVGCTNTEATLTYDTEPGTRSHSPCTHFTSVLSTVCSAVSLSAHHIASLSIPCHHFSFMPLSSHEGILPLQETTVPLTCTTVPAPVSFAIHSTYTSAGHLIPVHSDCLLPAFPQPVSAQYSFKPVFAGGNACPTGPLLVDGVSTAVRSAGDMLLLSAVTTVSVSIIGLTSQSVSPGSSCGCLLPATNETPHKSSGVSASVKSTSGQQMLPTSPISCFSLPSMVMPITVGCRLPSTVSQCSSGHGFPLCDVSHVSSVLISICSFHSSKTVGGMFGLTAQSSTQICEAQFSGSASAPSMVPLFCAPSTGLFSQVVTCSSSLAGIFASKNSSSLNLSNRIGPSTQPALSNCSVSASFGTALLTKEFGGSMSSISPCFGVSLFGSVTTPTISTADVCSVSSSTSNISSGGSSLKTSQLHFNYSTEKSLLSEQGLKQACGFDSQLGGDLSLLTGSHHVPASTTTAVTSPQWKFGTTPTTMIGDKLLFGSNFTSVNNGHSHFQSPQTSFSSTVQLEHVECSSASFSGAKFHFGQHDTVIDSTPCLPIPQSSAVSVPHFQFGVQSLTAVKPTIQFGCDSFASNNQPFHFGSNSGLIFSSVFSLGSNPTLASGSSVLQHRSSSILTTTNSEYQFGTNCLLPSESCQLQFGSSSTSIGSSSTSIGASSTSIGSSSAFQFGKHSAPAFGSSSFGTNSAPAFGSSPFHLRTNPMSVCSSAFQFGKNLTSAGIRSALKFGTNPTCISSSAFQFGTNPTSSASSAFQFGTNPTSSGSSAFHFGTSRTSSGSSAFQFGTNPTNSGSSAFQFGTNPTSSGSSAFQFGTNPTSSGSSAFQFGTNPTSNGSSAFQFGTNPTSSGSSAFHFGTNPTSSSSSAFQFGTNPTSSGSSAFHFGTNPTSSGSSAFQFGTNPTSSGSSAFQFGTNPTSSGSYAFQLGTNPTSSGISAFQFGASPTTSCISHAFQFGSNSSLPSNSCLFQSRSNPALIDGSNKCVFQLGSYYNVEGGGHAGGSSVFQHGQVVNTNSIDSGSNVFQLTSPHEVGSQFNLGTVCQPMFNPGSTGVVGGNQRVRSTAARSRRRAQRR